MLSSSRPPHSRGGATPAATPATSTPTTATPTTATPATTSSRVTVRWEIHDFDHTDGLIQILNTHPGACCVLFNKSKRSHNPTMSEPKTLGSQKSHIWVTIAQTIFAEDEEYKNTSAGINPLDATGAKNLQDKVYFLANFSWFNTLDTLWKSNPVFAPKMISSAPGVYHASDMAALTQGKGKGKGKEIAPPPPDTYDVIGDIKIDLNDNIADVPLLTQGKGKEKAPPLPSSDELMDEAPSPDDTNHSSHIPQVNMTLPSTLFNDANNDMDDHAINCGVIHTSKPPSSLTSSSSLT
ncbi:hypothetical protein BD769DRAFT_1385573 [Suillus cothurnatus]|nr:hypothetical protein BD769DRAFT_1385573 [Suillus cothurnatus]